MLVKFVQNRIIQTVQNFELFDKNGQSFFFFIQSVDTILEDVSVRLSSFSVLKITVARQV